MAIVTCSSCGARNRVEDRGAGVTPVCGRCGTALAAGSAGKPLEVTDATFEREVLGVRGRPVLLDCWAEWCPPCRALAPTINALAAEAAGRWVIAKLDIEQNPGVKQQFGIQGIPTLLFFKDGQLVEQLAGARPKGEIEARLRAHAT